MEEADVKQLISLIESAQLQYEVDESGTVSIVCDPVQLVGSSEEISDTVLASNAVSNSTNILTPNLEVTLVSGEDDEKDVTDIIAISSVVEKTETFKDAGLPKVKEEKIEQSERQETCEEEDNEGEAEPQLQLSPSGHYFFQTPDGQIIQVLGPIGEDDEESSALEEVEAVECGGSEASSSVGDDQVQIFVVGGNSTEDVFLINTPDRAGKDAAQSPVSVSSVMLKSNTLVDIAQDSSEISEHTYMGPSISSSSIAKSSKDHEEDLVPICQQEDSNSNGHSLNDSSKMDDLEVEKSLVQNMSTSKPIEMSVASLSTQDPLLTITPNFKQCILLNPKTKKRLPLKMHLPRKSLGEGKIVQTDRGDMIAHNLSSVAKYQQKGPNGQNTILQNIASVFGSVVKVLRPVEEEKEPKENIITNRFSILTCEECGATLHSERSLQIHCRRYHKEWNDECFVCGAKFLNAQYVRSHIQAVHSKETSFQCRLCLFKCSVLKEFLKHRKNHEKSQCNKCGKKYIMHKLFKEHVINCKVKEKVESKRKSLSNLANKKESSKEEDHQWSDFEDEFNSEYRKRGKKLKKVDSPVVNDKVVESNSTLNTVPNIKKSTKNVSGEEAIKCDGEFKIKSKHYNQQIEKMSVDQNFHRTNRTSRDRTHRCYLCFKLFSTAASLEAHKENYHLAKSDRPVRVKTDLRLDEKDEEDLVESSAAGESESLFSGAPDQVVVKEEPMDFKEEFENVTIILDECMKSTHVIKPLCIACKAHTNTDFRKSSNWFNKIPDGHQSNALKKFQQFLPYVIDSQSIIEPWVLCKKCALLIDKIADMENKLNSMKCDLMSRLNGTTGHKHHLEIQHCNMKENTDLSEVACDREGSKKISNIDIDILEMNEGIGKSLADIEAYMKETCEIMEITKPRKGPGRPRRQEIEKLTPVLVSEEEERACMTNMVKYITKGIIKKERESSSLCSMETEGTEMQCKETSTKINEQVLIKSEPIENCFRSVLPNSESMFWDDTASSSLSSLTTLQEDTLLVVNSNINKEKFTLGSLSAQVIKKELKMSDKELDRRSIRNFQTEVLDDCDQNSNCISEVSNTLPPDNSPAFFSNTTHALHVADENTTKNHEIFKGKKHDMPACTEPRDVNTNLMANCDGDDTQDGMAKIVDDPEISTSTDEHKDLQLSRVPSEEREVTGVGNQLKVLGKKRSQMREEREKMCYRTEGTSKKPWICSECHKGFSTQRGACDHYAASHKGQSFSCDHCSASYVRKRDLIGHYNKVHFNIKPYKCKIPECTEIFSTHNDLYRHLQSVHSVQNDASFDCHICSATFAKKRYRDAHVTVCVSKSGDAEPHKCPLCEKPFKLSRYLQLHMRSVHSWKKEQFFCEICSKLLTDKRNFILHMKSHLGETRVSCEVCGKQFNRKSYLWTHMRIHNNQRPYGCNYCTKWFKQYSTWKNHERTHTGEKPFKCFVCNANFSTHSSAAKHVQYAHFNIRKYSCDICKKTFISKPKLEEHNKVHTGEKPFKCHVCNRAFNKKNNLATHMYVHSTNKRYRCELCGEGFMRRSTIESHITDCHKLEFLLGSNSANTNAEKEEGTVAFATAPFISLVGADDISGEDSYIVIYADENEDHDNSKEMQVTVLAEDNASNQVAVTSKHDSLSTDCGEVITSVESSDVLSEVILEDSSSKRSDSVLTLIPKGEVSTITMQENDDASITQVMEIDPSHFRLVTSEDTSGSIYTE
ncbi:uncharacterized protein [Procambarus clarkii]|uniref:uncharacterized protein n=1 Tax=Procambarus clarkii TaxID=6728 RepID=UPI003742AB89